MVQDTEGEALVERPREELIERPHAGEPTGKLVTQLLKQAAELARKEVALARAEVKSDVKRELSALKGLGVAVAFGFFGVSLLLVSAVMGLALVMPAWGAALVVGGVMLAIGAAGGLIGWTRRVRTPLSRTKKSLKEDVKWAKERMA